MRSSKVHVWCSLSEVTAKSFAFAFQQRGDSGLVWQHIEGHWNQSTQGISHSNLSYLLTSKTGCEKETANDEFCTSSSVGTKVLQFILALPERIDISTTIFVKLCQVTLGIAALLSFWYKKRAACLSESPGKCFDQCLLRSLSFHRCFFSHLKSPTAVVQKHHALALLMLDVFCQSGREYIGPA